jgi:N-acetylmuramoyl-L-alanine amidase
MGSRVYLSPSTQDRNITAIGTTEEYHAHIIADLVGYHLNRHGVEYKVASKDFTEAYEFINDSKSFDPQCHVAIHTNAGGGTGCEVWGYKVGEGTSSENLSRSIYKYLEVLTPWQDRGVKDGYAQGFFEVNDVQAVSCIVEIVFHDNEEQIKWMVDNYKPVSEAIAHGILDFLGYTWVNEAPVVMVDSDVLKIKIRSMEEAAIKKDNQILVLTRENDSLKTKIDKVNEYINTLRNIIQRGL